MFLHIAGGVGVGVQREGCLGVTEDTGQGFSVYARSQRMGRKCVPLRYNNDKPENPNNDGRFEGLSHLFHSFSNHEKAGQKS